MHHFFIEPSQMNLNDQKGCIKGADVHHIQKVLRLTEGNQVSVSDGQGRRYLAVIRSLDAEKVDVELIRQLHSAPSSRVKPVRLVQGIAKGSKMDWIIQKNTEMGVQAFQPVNTEHTVVKFSGFQDVEKKQMRWQKIAEEASKQSKRTTIPVVEKPMSLEAMIRQNRHIEGNWLRLLAYEKEAGSRLSDYLKPESLEKYDGIEMWIGPEGGFSTAEVEMARLAGIHTIGLGPRILRTETASLVLLSVILYEMGVLEES